MVIPLPRFATRQMHASGLALRGFAPCPDSALYFLTRLMHINVGMPSKTSLDSEQGAKPEGTIN